MVANKRVEDTVAETLKPVEAAVNVGKESFEKAVKAGTEAAQKGYEQYVAFAKENAEKVSEQIFKNYGELSALQKDNTEAIMKSSTILLKGFETVAKELVAQAQASIEANMNAAKAFVGVKTIKEAMDLQGALTKTHMDKVMADGTKVAEMSMAVANKAFEPLKTRVDSTIESLTKASAA
ncbi:MAG: phasin family protein [Rhodospirillales bacterium]|nr:phasin family protein [Rhodospirillales bacterium]